jgi:HEPN domain-containing protein
MSRQVHRYTRSDGYEVADLLQYGLDDIEAARRLFKEGASFYDAGGYLAHIGFELLLKGWVLELVGSFPQSHHLESIWSEVSTGGEQVSLSIDHMKTLRLLDKYEELRYPTARNPIEIGSDDIPRIEALLSVLHSLMPQKLRGAIANLHWSTKGGRILMERPESGV